MKKVALQPWERRFADPEVIWKVTFSKGYYLFLEKTPQMECDQEVNQQTYGIESLFPHTRAFQGQAVWSTREEEDDIISLN